MTMTKRPVNAVAALFLVLSQLKKTAGFGVVDLPAVEIGLAPQNVASFLSSTADSFLSSYQAALNAQPLQTQVETGVVLAVVGDAIAQQQTPQQGQQKTTYDAKRAISFVLFDVCWRVVQHYLYPPLIENFQGDTLNPIFHDSAAAVEQALVSQLVMIPIFYYPTFFAVTGFVQGLDVKETIERATSNFFGLMIRNWLFWIPVQYAVFQYCSVEQQISVLIVAGLIWTVILSVVAGAASSKEQSPETGILTEFKD